jgi:hypothetical protein
MNLIIREAVAGDVEPLSALATEHGSNGRTHSATRTVPLKIGVAGAESSYRRRGVGPLASASQPGKHGCQYQPAALGSLSAEIDEQPQFMGKGRQVVVNLDYICSECWI